MRLPYGVKKDLFFEFQLTEQLTPYPQPRFYDPVSSRTFGRSHDIRSREQKRFHFDSDQSNHHHHSHRNDRLLHHDPNAAGNGHHHNHHHNEIIERIDEVIELVDCGGRDLGFCDMSSKYPG